MRWYIVLLIGALWPMGLAAQDTAYARSVIAELASDTYKGRGYAHAHDSLAANYLAGEFRRHGVKAPQSGYLQPFTLNTNTFPGKMIFSTGSDTLRPGKDFLVCSYSQGAKGTFPLLKLQKGQQVVTRDTFNGFLLMNYRDFGPDKTPNCRDLKHLYEYYPQPAYIEHGPAGVIYRVPELSYYTPANDATNYTMLMLKDSIALDATDSLKLQIQQEMLAGHRTSNIIGYVPGKTDTTIAITAHYDHIGMMGQQTYFPGAHDNASGTATVLDLARYYAESNPHYTMVFILFSGEELGLKGSLHYTQNPVFPLEQTKFVINLDLMGSGSKGITVVNGKTHPRAFQLLDSLNQKHHYLPSIKARGTAKNSDHWPFYNKGVPAFFIYTRGDYAHYHNIHDRAAALPLSGYNGVFRLVNDFIHAIKPLPRQNKNHRKNE